MAFSKATNWLAILLNDGDLHLAEFSEYPATYRWGRDGEVPTTYVTKGRTFRGKKFNLKYRHEGHPTDPEIKLDDSEIGKIITVIDSDHSKSESLRAQAVKEMDITFWFGVIMGVVIGLVGGLIASHFIG